MIAMNEGSAGTADTDAPLRAMVRAVSKYYKVSVADILGSRKPEPLATIRGVAIYLGRQRGFTDRVLEAFFNKQRGNVIHRARSIATRLEVEPVLAKDMAAILSGAARGETYATFLRVQQAEQWKWNRAGRKPGTVARSVGRPLNPARPPTGKGALASVKVRMCECGKPCVGKRPPCEDCKAKDDRAGRNPGRDPYQKANRKYVEVYTTTSSGWKRDASHSY